MNVLTNIRLIEIYPLKELNREFYFKLEFKNKNASRIFNYPFGEEVSSEFRKQHEIPIRIFLCKNHIAAAKAEFVLSSNSIENKPKDYRRMVSLEIIETAKKSLFPVKFPHSSIRVMLSFDFFLKPLNFYHLNNTGIKEVNRGNTGNCNIHDYNDDNNDINNDNIYNIQHVNSKNMVKKTLGIKSSSVSNFPTNINSNTTSNAISSSQSKKNIKKLVVSNSGELIKSFFSVSEIAKSKILSNNNSSMPNLTSIFSEKVNNIPSLQLPINLNQAYLYTVQSSENLLKSIPCRSSKYESKKNKNRNKNGTNTSNTYTNSNNNFANFASKNNNNNNKKSELEKKGKRLMSMINYLNIKKIKATDRDSEVLSRTVSGLSISVKSPNGTRSVSFESRREKMEKRRGESYDRYLSKLQQYRNAKERKLKTIEKNKEKLVRKISDSIDNSKYTEILDLTAENEKILNLNSINSINIEKEKELRRAQSKQKKKKTKREKEKIKLKNLEKKLEKLNYRDVITSAIEKVKEDTLVINTYKGDVPKFSVKPFFETFFTEIYSIYSKAMFIINKIKKMLKNELAISFLVLNNSMTEETQFLYNDELSIPEKSELEIEKIKVKTLKNAINLGKNSIKICVDTLNVPLDELKVKDDLSKIRNEKICRSKYIKKMLLGILIKNIDKVKYNKPQMNELEYLAEKYQFVFDEEANKEDRLNTNNNNPESNRNSNSNNNSNFMYKKKNTFTSNNNNIEEKDVLMRGSKKYSTIKSKIGDYINSKTEKSEKQEKQEKTTSSENNIKDEKTELTSSNNKNKSFLTIKNNFTGSNNETEKKKSSFLKKKEYSEKMKNQIKIN